MSEREQMPNVNAVAPSEPVQVVPPPAVGTEITGPGPTHFAGGLPTVMTGTQLPAEQPVPGPQTVPQAPQLLSSSALFVQRPPQFASGAGQALVQPFDTHSGLPLGQTLPQAPQLFGSTDVTTHWPLHIV